MASARGIRAGAAYVELFISDSKLVRGLEKASKKLKAFGEAVTGWGTAMAKIGAAITAPLAGSAKLFSEMGDRLAKMSQRTGVSVETLSELGYAADLSGADLETLETALRKMQKALVEAAEGSESAQAALTMIGLTVEELRGLTPDEQFKRIADKLAAIKSPAVKAAVAMELFGRTGARLLPLLAGGAKGIEELQAQARALGLTMSTEDAKAAEALNDAIDTLWKTLKQGVFVVGSALAPMLKDLGERLTALVVSATDWIRQNKAWVVWALKIGAAVLAAGAALVALGSIITSVGAVLGALGTIFAAVGSAVGIIGTALSYVLTPLGLVIAGAVALGAYLVYATGIGGQALEWLGQKFQELWDFASQAFGGIADALMAGDIALAAQILWLTLKVAWLKGVQVLETMWLNFKHTFIRIAYAAYFGAQAAWEEGVHAMTVVWIEGVAGLKTVWANFTAWHANTVETMANWMAKRWVELQGMFDDTIDVEFQKKYIDDQSKQQFGQIDKDRAGAVNAAEQTRADSRKAAEDEHTTRMTEIGNAANAADQALADEYNQKTKAAQDELDQAKEDWQKAIAEAKKKRELADANRPQRVGSKPGVPDDFEGIGDAIQQKAKSVAVLGTFSAVEASRYGGNPMIDRIAKASEATAKNTKRLVDKAEDGGLVFD